MQSYKEGLTFIVAKTVKDITNYGSNLLKLAKVFSKYPMPQLIPLLSSILSPLMLVRNLPSLKQIRKSITISQTKILFIIYLNCKVFIESAMKIRNF